MAKYDTTTGHLLKDTHQNEYRSALETTQNSNGRKSSVVQQFLYQTKASIFSTSINICNINIGAGVLGLPFGVRYTGYIFAIILFIIFAFIMAFGFQLLMSIGACYCYRGEISSYAIVCNDAAPKLQVLIDFFIAFGGTLVCTAYLIVIGDYMPLVTKELFFKNINTTSIFITRQFWILAFVIVLILPTTAFRTLDELRFSSMFAIICFIYVAIIITLYELLNYHGFDIEDEQTGDIQAFPTSILNFFEAAPLYIFAFGGHGIAFVLVNELKNPTLRRINITLINAFSFVAIIYAIIGLFGYFTFGDKTKSNILLNYPDDDIVIISVRIGISIAVSFSYPVVANQWKQSMACLLFKIDKKGKDASNIIWYKYYILVVMLIFVTLTISLIIDDLGIVLKLQGATSGTFRQIITPGLIYYYYHKLGDKHMLNNKIHNVQLKGAIFLIVFGCIVMPFATTLIFV